VVHQSSHTDHHNRDHLIYWAWLYDLGSGLLGRRGRRLRETIADDLALQPGDHVLDVGCGPGRLARVFAERVAPTGSVTGIDPSQQMINRATAQAGKHGVPVRFQVGYAQSLPFPDAMFDAVACTLALHHVAEDDQQTAVAEMYRVLKPGGRLLIAEFQKGPGLRHPRPRWLRRSTHEDMIDRARNLVTTAGFTGISGAGTNLSWLAKITARK
jgi:ubiquinone/menaquinone biosynthesis C-methylase UbiE